ncbi:MAG: hypothetical protein ABH820_03920, partial [Patescibacteria group bacterium]
MYAIAIIISLITAIIAVFVNPKLVILIPYGVVVPLLVLLPRFVYSQSSKMREHVNKNWVTNMEMVCVFIILLNAPGSLWLHDTGIQYDRVIHYGAGFFVFFLLLMFYVSLKNIENGKKEKILLAILVVSFVGLFAWEGFQWFLDQNFGTKVFFDLKQSIELDVTEDILYGTLGLFT